MSTLPGGGLAAEPRSLLTLWEQEDLAEWLDAEEIPERLPFLLDPDGGYDMDLDRWACRNVVLTGANQMAWRQHLDRLDQALASGAMLAPYVRHRVTQQRAEITRFLSTAVWKFVRGQEPGGRCSCQALGSAR